MAAAGIDPKAIDTVLISHFHSDHINGLRAKAGSLNFPNAEIMVPAADMKFFLDAGEESKAPQPFKQFFAATKRVFEPIVKDVKQYEHGKELVPGITAVDARGHSPGHTAFLVSSGNGKLLVTSDTANHQILIRNPEWALWADMDPAMAAVSTSVHMPASRKYWPPTPKTSTGPACSLPVQRGVATHLSWTASYRACAPSARSSSTAAARRCHRCRTH
jgi:glyoxylase-like metal-dependent hydrolase (beta-lactamase superfamily II)